MWEYTIIAAIATVGAIAITKIVRHSTDFRLKLLKKDFAELQNYTAEVEAENKSLKNKLNNRERGPQLEDSSDWASLIQAFVGDLSAFVPRKLQPLLQDKELQNALIQKFMENPDRYKDLIKRFIVPRGREETVVEDAI